MKSAILAAALCAVSHAVRLNDIGAELANTPGVRRHEYVTFEKHHVFRRDVEGEQPARHTGDFVLPVNVFQKQFNLMLSPATDLFTTTATLAGAPIAHHGYYQGKVMGRTESFVHVHIDEGGAVSGKFFEHPSRDNFYIRPADSSEGRHVVYQEESNRTAEYAEAQKAHATCGSDDLEKPDGPSPGDHARGRRGVAADAWSPAANLGTDGKTYCEMALFADRAFMAEYGTAGGGSTAAAIGLMIERLTLAQEVMDTVRDAGATTGTIQHAQVVLKIAWIDFFDATSASNTLSATEIDGFIATQTETKGYLEQFSRFDWSPYCLAHVYTYTDFEGTLGLAWTAYPDSANHNGGICQARYNDGAIGGEVSLNTAWHSSKNFGTKQTESQSELVLAHELGHNFGSPHDLQSTDGSGDYVMYKYAVSGTEDNNEVFSPQSQSAINAAMTDRASCFVNQSTAVCGNTVIEVNGADAIAGNADDEQCDNGGVQGIDPCCSTAAAGATGACQFRTDGLTTPAQCTPMDPVFADCCDTTTCQKLGGSLCGIESECAKRGSCDAALGCPAVEDVSRARPENTVCEPGLVLGATAKGTMLCGPAGTGCSVSVCIKLGLVDCVGDDDDSGETACELHCRDGAGVCTTISALPETITFTAKFVNGDDAVIVGETAWTRPPGAACEFENGEPLSGVCSEESKCLAADQEEDTLGELYKQYNQFKDTFVSWVNGEKAGLPIWGWLIIAGTLLIMTCCGGCYAANKPAIQTFKEQRSVRRQSKGAQGPVGI